MKTGFPLFRGIVAMCRKTTTYRPQIATLLGWREYVAKNGKTGASRVKTALFSQNEPYFADKLAGKFRVGSLGTRFV
ncbi:hypothetical protein [Spirosoma humi]